MTNHLERLKQSLTDKTPEERLAKLRDIREDRKISKHAITTRAKRTQDKGAKLKDRFKAMTSEEQAQFLETLTNEDKTGEDQ